MATTSGMPQESNPAPYAGPRDSDPLTEDELSLLLAIPRAARASPDATLFRLPRGTDPSLGCVDVTCAETYSIVARLAAQWDAKLSGILHQRTQGSISRVGPGTTVCMLLQPPVFGLFHLLAFFSLGCTIQCISTDLDELIIDDSLALSGSKIFLHSGVNDTWIRERGERFDGDMIELPEDEFAHRLVESERQKTVQSVPAWPTPHRPTPAFILQSSGTTSMPKLLKFSLYFYTIGLKFNCQTYLAFANSQHSGSKKVYTHPRVMISPPYWQSFYQFIFIHISTATPLAIAPISDPLNLSPKDFIAWVRTFDAGGTISATYLIRETLLNGTYAQDLKDLYSVQVLGSAVDKQTSELFENSGIALVNTYGSSEFGRVLFAPRAPYNLLRPFPDLPPPLFNPVTECRPDGSRDVELWYSASTSPWFAHVFSHGEIPLNVEPFPGQGPHHGEPAVNSNDIFCEMTTGTSNETRYMHLGRADDWIRVRGGQKNLDASAYEARLRSSLEGPGVLEGWRVDAVQVFGSGLPAMALVVQLRPSTTEEHSTRDLSRELRSELLVELARRVDAANAEMNLGAFRVNPEKRFLVLTTEGGVYGPGVERLTGRDGGNPIPVPRLTLTHKHTLRRWANVKTFKPWLDVLDYTEP